MTDEVEYWDGTGLTPAMLEAEVRRIAEADPNHIYRPTTGALCRYTEKSGKPGCIIGHAVFNLTGKLVEQREMSGGISTYAWTTALARKPDTATDAYVWPHEGDQEIHAWLVEVQANQDVQIAWGRAVSDADEKFCRI